MTNPAPEDLTHHEVRRITREGLTIVHSVVGRRSAGDAIPVVRLLPAHPTGRLTIIAHPRGKAALATSAGEPAPLAQALLSLGQSVVGFDPLFVGESLDPRNPAVATPRGGALRDLQPVVAADQMQDLATVLAWAKSQPDVREVSLIGQDLAGPQVLLARPASRAWPGRPSSSESPDPQPIRRFPAAARPSRHVSVRRLQGGRRAAAPLRSGSTGAASCRRLVGQDGLRASSGADQRPPARAARARRRPGRANGSIAGLIRRARSGDTLQRAAPLQRLVMHERVDHRDKHRGDEHHDRDE